MSVADKSIIPFKFFNIVKFSLICFAVLWTNTETTFFKFLLEKVAFLTWPLTVYNYSFYFCYYFYGDATEMLSKSFSSHHEISLNTYLYKRVSNKFCNLLITPHTSYSSIVITSDFDRPHAVWNAVDVSQVYFGKYVNCRRHFQVDSVVYV